MKIRSRAVTVSLFLLNATKFLINIICHLGSDLGPEFSIDNWPCKFTKARDALEKIKSEGRYDVSPLPATTTNGKPLLPSEYEKKLAGATVLVRISLTSNVFTKGHQFYADIESLTILRPPKIVISQSPSKSPSKKRRFAVPDFIQHSRFKKHHIV
jgi:hypothetical protein